MKTAANLEESYNSATVSANCQTAAAYIRVSTHDQEELSPDSQIRMIKDYCKKNNMILHSDYIFVDGGISGRKASSRPEFQRMISMAKEEQHCFDVILVWKFSRFARNQEESIVYKTLLKKNNVEVLSISEPLIDGPFGSLIERIIEWMDEYYSIRLAGDVKRGMTENALRGGYQATAPLGYKNENKSLVQVLSEVDVVKLIYRKYIDDDSTLSEITHLVNSLGYRTKKGGVFDFRGIKYILQNPVYKGYVRWNVGRNNLRATKANTPDMIVAKGDFEGIFSEEYWELAQEKLLRNYTYQKRERPLDYKKHWLSGLLKCSACGGSLSYTTRNNTLQCVNYFHAKCKVSHHIYAHNATASILDSLRSFVDSTNYYSVVASESSLDVDKELLESSLAKLLDKEMRIKEAYRNGIDTMDEYKENKLIIENERIYLQSELDKLSPAIIDTDYDEEMSNRIQGVLSVLESDADHHAKSIAIRSICDSITYHKVTKELEIHCIYRV